MEKVILITSREFVADNGSMIPIVEDYVTLFFQRDSKNPTKGLSGHLRERDEFWKFFKKGENDGLYICENGENSLLDDYSKSGNQFKTRNEHNDLMDNKYLGVASDLIQERGCLTTKGNEIVALIKNEKKQDSQFVPGVYEMSSIGDDVRVFVAEEYPYDKEDRVVFSGLKQMYMNALIEMVMNYVGEEVKGDLKYDWLILSHDADWGQPRECTVFKNSLGEINENFPHLKKIVEAATGDGIAKTQIFCFQHDTNSIYYNRIKEFLLWNADSLFSCFTGLNANVRFFENYLKNGVCDNNLDLTKPFLYSVNTPAKFDFSEIKNNTGIFVYDDPRHDNCLLLEILRGDRRRTVMMQLLKQADKENKLPLVIKMKTKVFEDLPDYVSGKEDASWELDHKLDFDFSFINNSSIWIRLVNANDNNSLQKAICDFSYFKEIGLFEYSSAHEFFECNMRMQNENYLEQDNKDNKSGHGKFVTPILYGNEVKFKEKIVTELLSEKKVERPNEIIKFGKSKLSQYSNLTLRILVIDDKIGCYDDNNGCPYKLKSNCLSKECEIKLERCNNCSRKTCKLKLISTLMENTTKDEKYKYNESKPRLVDFCYWKENSIETFICPTTFEDFIFGNTILDNIFHVYPKGGFDIHNCEKNKAININVDFSPTINPNNTNVQIIGVRDVRTALVLLCRFKFDMVFCDYLLDKKRESSEKRDYANMFFTFLSHDYKEKVRNERDEEKKKHFQVLENFQRSVYENLGPLDKLWIMPITGFNQTFITDLYRNHINLIDYKWNISNGADPINTPWQFLYHLNKFIELQLRSCVYRIEQLLRFLLYTCEHVSLKENHGFYGFQAFMGAEYASFMRRYGNRRIIQRDAFMEEEQDNTNKSVFATYIWESFYKKPENRDVIELNRLIQRFLQQASTMHNDHDGQRRLDEYFGFLCSFINTNIKIKEEMKKHIDLKDLNVKLEELHNIMDGISAKGNKGMIK